MSKNDAAQIWSLTYRLVMEVTSGVASEVRALGLEVKEVFVLAALDEHPHPAELAEELCMPKPTVSVTVKRLQAAGLVTREIDPDDLRRHRLSLTPAGRKKVTRGMELLIQAFGERVERLSGTERTQLTAMLKKMG